MIATAAAKLFEGIWTAAPADVLIEAVVTDSRKVVPGCVFVCIKGERVDGHDYAAGAIKDGAVAVVAQHPVEGVPAMQTVLVTDPLDAMIAMGANYRSQFSPMILAVTGSVGKTTTKEFCAEVLSAFGETLKTEGNQNNEIGMPNTLFRLDENTRYAVVEMGMQGLGEIHKLSMAARPSAAIITKIGTAHIEKLGTQENILRAKLEVCDGLVPGAPLVLNGDDPLLRSASLPAHVQAVYTSVEDSACDVWAESIVQESNGQRFLIVDKQYGKHAAYIPAMGKHNVSNALQAYAAATRMGLGAETAAVALADFRTTGMRQRVENVADITLMIDCYNASPDSMRAALATFGEMPVKGKKIVAFGDMLELGDIAQQAHAEIGRQCEENGVSFVATVGPLAAYAAEEAQRYGVDAVVCDTNEEAAEVILAKLKPGDAVLLKASRGMKFEEIAEALMQKLEQKQ